MKGSDFFNRCEYTCTLFNEATGRADSHRNVFIIRNYGSGESCIDACVESWENGVPSELMVKEIRSDPKAVVPESLEIIHRESGNLIIKVSDFFADPKDYTAEELISQPHLLQDGNVSGFKRAFLERR